ncbi:MAG: glutamate 5-kinase [bacterium]
MKSAKKNAKTASANSALLVVKIGSGLLTNNNGGIDQVQIENICRQIVALKLSGHEVAVVSSGAISSGMTMLELKKRPADLCMLQACATLGQPRLMQAYETAFNHFQLHAAQILVTSWDLDSRKMRQNLQATVRCLLDLKNCVPVFNENDALSFEEIEMLNRFGDNDQLSAHVALLLGASRLIILSGIEGLKTRADGGGKLVRRVTTIDERIESYAGRSRSEHSVGGMISKLKTARLMLQHGVPMVIANGREPDVLLKIARGERVGTWFEK